ncbi:PLD nuclease N-terminal domain-containing protein [Leucobacter sp. UT-8R-CII-1-4]|uniref:PLD nuclease N-terminal domain-containing protein n=1 Tax=Leucobacter sp. UT-8R-CII-1-4 TaxID=3040075 RepID=UPI0024A81B39|nr:PLD nuclease N-terminal domain-containing protein [Leucobacter sp. UT-8R-CII-1-4]MDI6022779.1 PLD nuclease N-terminal domain-containing protein [Leucobacter sp. UT-8R-CII-1-4]
MVRFAIIGVIIGVALILYALVDAAMSDASRARGVSKPVWVVLIVALPVIGAVLWLTIGKGRGPAPVKQTAPDDDPRFTGTRLSTAEIDAHVEELEARLRELDNEVFPTADESAVAGDASGEKSTDNPADVSKRTNETPRAEDNKRDDNGAAEGDAQR